MNQFVISAPAPCEADRKLQKLFDDLAADIAAASQKRANVAAESSANTNRHKALKSARELKSDPQESAQLDADLAALTITCAMTELALLEVEVDLADRILHYLPRAREARQRARAVAAEMVTLAEHRVVEVFEREWPRKHWPMSGRALAAFIAQHPVVLGAREQLAELDTDNEALAAQATAQTREQMARQITLLQGSIAEQRNVLRIATAKVQQFKERAAAQQAAAQSAEAKRLADHAAILGEAKKRLALA